MKPIKTLILTILLVALFPYAFAVDVVIQRKKTGSKATIGKILVAGTEICEYLEYPTHPPFKFLPTGSYDAAVRTDGPKGWRIELKGTAPFTNIQIHVGNSWPDTQGCFLAGTNADAEKPWVNDSLKAMKALRDAVEKAGGTIKIIIRGP